MTARIDRHLDHVRAGLPTRLRPEDLDAVRSAGGLIVDTRPAHLRERDGDLPGAIVVDRNQLEWRMDPTCEHSLDVATDADAIIVVVCDEGYASSSAAESLQRLGLRGATDLEGGYQAWRSWTAGRNASQP